MLIPENEIEYSRYSLMDDFGKVFFWKDRVFRGIKDSEALFRYEELVKSGLLPALIEADLFPKTFLTEYKTDLYAIVIEHEKISPASFIYEWPFHMVKAAGHCVLSVNKIAYRFGFETIDAHPYNILFKGCKPLFIDLGSFKALSNSKSWRALEEFNGFYLYPLKIWNKVSYAMARRIYADLSIFSRKEFEDLSELHLPKVIKRGYGLLKRVKRKLLSKIVNADSSKEFFKLKYSVKATQWNNYHESYIINNQISISDRFKYIIQKTRELNIKTVTELAANQGVLSCLLLKELNLDHIVCTDYDEIAVNKMFNFFSASEFKERISPVLIDFMRPVELYIAGKPADRFKSDAVFALAVTHHLVLTQQYDLSTVLKKISEYTSKYAFIEFMPLGLWDGTNAPPLPQWYTRQWFKSVFEHYFEIIEIKEVDLNRLLFIGKIKNEKSH